VNTRMCITCRGVIMPGQWASDPAVRATSTHPGCPTPEQEMDRLAAAGDWVEAERIQCLWDWALKPVPNQLARAAAWYASLGLAVLRLQPGGKTPYPGETIAQATTDPAQITAWWQDTPQANIAIATGRLVDVVNLDGPLGLANWGHLTHQPAPIGWAYTPSGHHLYLPAQQGRGCTHHQAPGLDYRGPGGWAVAPPSWSNTPRGPYLWRQPPNLGGPR